MTPSPGTIPEGPRTAVHIRLFEAPSRELIRALRGPRPRWMERLYELEQAAEHTDDPEEGEVSVGTAVLALGERLAHRLTTAAFVITAMEELGWTATLDGDAILLTGGRMMPEAIVDLEAAGVYGPLTKVCDLDERGLPLFIEGWRR